MTSPVPGYLTLPETDAVLKQGLITLCLWAGQDLIDHVDSEAGILFDAADVARLKELLTEYSLRAQAVAPKLKVSAGAVRAAAVKGHIDCCRIGGQWRFREIDVTRAAEQLRRFPLTRTAAAARLGVSAATLAKWERLEMLEGYRFGGLIGYGGPTFEAVLRLRRQGRSANEITREFRRA